MDTLNPTPIRDHIGVLRDRIETFRESLLDCDIAVDDARIALEAAIRQRSAVAAELEVTIEAYELRALGAA